MMGGRRWRKGEGRGRIDGWMDGIWKEARWMVDEQMDGWRVEGRRKGEWVEDEWMGDGWVCGWRVDGGRMDGW